MGIGGNLYALNIPIEPTGIYEFDSDEFTIYPNPSDGKFTINTAFNTACAITIIDAQGKTIRQLTDERKIFSVNISNYSSGIYLIKIQTENKTIVKKIIKN